MTPGRKFSTTISAVATSRRTASTACGVFKSSTMLFLPALSCPKLVLAPLRNGGRVRIMSPSGASILITSAPKSANNLVPCGPAIVVVKSSTRTRSKAPVIMNSPKCRSDGAGSGPRRECQAGSTASDRYEWEDRGSAPRQPVPEHEGQLAPGRDPDRLVEVLPAAGEQLVEERAINPEHHGGRAHFATRAGGDGLRGGRVMSFGQPGDVSADIGERRLREHPARGRDENSVRLQQFARQIQPVPPGVFGEVTKYVGELQRAPEFRCNALAGWRLLSEDPYREPADSDGHALAIRIEHDEARRPNIGASIHFHAVDNGEEIITPQTIEMDGFA